MHLRLRKMSFCTRTKQKSTKVKLCAHQHSRNATVEYVSFVTSHRLTYRINAVHSASRPRPRREVKIYICQIKEGPPYKRILDSQNRTVARPGHHSGFKDRASLYVVLEQPSRYSQSI
jgi:hypothetical protein